MGGYCGEFWWQRVGGPGRPPEACQYHAGLGCYQQRRSRADQERCARDHGPRSSNRGELKLGWAQHCKCAVRLPVVIAFVRQKKRRGISTLARARGVAAACTGWKIKLSRSAATNIQRL